MPRFDSPINIVVPPGTPPLQVNQVALVANLNSDLLDGQHAAHFEGRDVTAFGFSGGTFTLTRASGNLTASISGSLLRAAGHPGYGDWNSFGNNTQTINQIFQENFNFPTGTGSSNFPNDVGYMYGVLMNLGTGTDARAQVYISHAGNDLIFRGGWGDNGWQTWNRCLTNQNFTGYAVSINAESSGWAYLNANTASTPVLRLRQQNASGGHLIQGLGSAGTEVFRVERTGEIYVAANQVIHAGNISSFALPLNGGTVSGMMVFSSGADPAVHVSGGSFANSTSHIYTSIAGVGKTRIQRDGVIRSLGLSVVSGTDINAGSTVFSVNNLGAVSAASFSGSGSGLTGTASGFTAGAVPWSGVTGKPTTIAGYGITNALSTSGGTVNGHLTIGSAFQVLAGSGTSLLPGYSFSGDTDTGLFRSGANSFDLVTGGSIRVTIGSAGIVSIFGTAAATSFSGAGTGLTGTASALNIGGNAATATNVAWSGITSKPTSISGFGITDAIDTSASSQTKAGSLAISGNLTVSGVTTTKSAGTKTGTPLLRHAQTIGDGYATSITVTHNLGTDDVMVQIRRVSDNVIGNYATSISTATNSVTVTFASAPLASQYRVVVFG